MPEGPEIRNLTKLINKEVKGWTIKNMKVLFGKYKRHGNPKGWDFVMEKLPLKIKSVKNRGKTMWFDLGEVIMMAQMGMKGYFTTTPDLKHNNIEFICDKGIFFFNDYRNFGNIWFVTKEELKEYLEKKLGPDPLQEKVTLVKFKKQLEQFERRRKSPRLGDILMEQNFIAGVGNYMRSEILYEAKLCPSLTVNELTNTQINDLHKAIMKIFEYSLKCQTKHGRVGMCFKVYRKKEDPDGREIKEMKMKDRKVWYVPEIQKCGGEKS